MDNRPEAGPRGPAPGGWKPPALRAEGGGQGRAEPPGPLVGRTASTERRRQPERPLPQPGEAGRADTRAWPARLSCVSPRARTLTRGRRPHRSPPPTGGRASPRRIRAGPRRGLALALCRPTGGGSEPRGPAEGAGGEANRRASSGARGGTPRRELGRQLAPSHTERVRAAARRAAARARPGSLTLGAPLPAVVPACPRNSILPVRDHPDEPVGWLDERGHGQPRVVKGGGSGQQHGPTDVPAPGTGGGTEGKDLCSSWGS